MKNSHFTGYNPEYHTTEKKKRGFARLLTRTEAVVVGNLFSPGTDLLKKINKTNRKQKTGASHKREPRFRFRLYIVYL